LKDGGSTPQNPDKTYKTASDQRMYATGFRQNQNGAPRDWKKYGDLQGSAQAVPDTLDLRPHLTQIENQGQCGSCWAFSLTATNRDGHAIGGTDPGRLSQEWLVDNSKEAAGCNGGDFDSANDFVNPGQPLWDACPYASGAGGCAANLAPAAHITGWHMLGDAANGPSVRDIETEIAASGKPVSIAVAAAAGDWMSYSSGIYNGCTAGQLDHMINIVGWDNEGAAFDANGNLPAGKGVWILRNSWGESWGESGYMRTRMTDATGARCNGVAEQAAYFDF
jgi:cathepsin L